MITLDKTDKKILLLLQQNAKSNIKEVALKIGLTQTPTYERIKRLEKFGVIKNYSAIIDKEKIGLHITVFCQVSLQVHSKELIHKFEHAVAKLDEITECHHVAGNFDYLLKIMVADMKDYQQFLTNKLSVLHPISNVQSNFVLSTTKEHHPLTL